MIFVSFVKTKSNLFTYVLNYKLGIFETIKHTGLGGYKCLSMNLLKKELILFNSSFGIISFGTFYNTYFSGKVSDS